MTDHWFIFFTMMPLALFLVAAGIRFLPLVDHWLRMRQLKRDAEYDLAKDEYERLRKAVKP